MGPSEAGWASLAQGLGTSYLFSSALSHFLQWSSHWQGARGSMNSFLLHAPISSPNETHKGEEEKRRDYGRGKRTRKSKWEDVTKVKMRSLHYMCHY